MWKKHFLYFGNLVKNLHVFNENFWKLAHPGDSPLNSLCGDPLDCLVKPVPLDDGLCQRLMPFGFFLKGERPRGKDGHGEHAKKIYEIGHLEIKWKLRKHVEFLIKTVNWKCIFQFFGIFLSEETVSNILSIKFKQGACTFPRPRFDPITIASPWLSYTPILHVLWGSWSNFLEPEHGIY